MIKQIEPNKKQIKALIEKTCKNWEVLKTTKGINIIAELKQELELNDLLFFRLFCFDDIFRIRNEVSKFYQNQYHRINRIWKIKNGIAKENLFYAEKKFDIDFCINIIKEQQKKIQEDKTNEKNKN